MKLLKREQTLHRQEQNQMDMISVNTNHLACAEGLYFSAVHVVSVLTSEQLFDSHTSAIVINGY